MKKIFILILFISTSTFVRAQSPQLQWARAMGGMQNDLAYAIVTDASGNVYTTGYFAGTADFDPGSSTYTLSSAGGFDVFVSKLDASGNFVWAKSMGGPQHDFGWAIALDASGNVYTTGSFLNGGDFDPGPSTYSMTSAGSEDAFISKLDASGNFVWAKQVGGTFGDIAESIKLDATGDLYVVGYFGGSGDYDPGAGVLTLNSVGAEDIFVLKLNSAGNMIFGESIGDIGSDYANSLAVDPVSGNIFITGSFQGTVDFDPTAGITNLTSAGSDDIFVLKLNFIGNFFWAKKMGGTTSDLGFAITADGSGNSYITGNFYGTADFDPGAIVYNLTSTGLADIFISKLDNFGNFVFAKSMGSAQDDNGQAIAIDASSNIFTSGYYSGIADLDPGIATYTVPWLGVADIFISKLDVNGNFKWAEVMGRTGYDYGCGITVDATGNDIYTSGFFQDTVDFDPFITTYTLSAEGGIDAFVHKMVPSTVGMKDQFVINQEFSIYPNPASTHLNIKTAAFKVEKIIMTDVLGKIILEESGNGTVLNIENLTNGIYFLKCYSGKKEYNLKFIKE